MWYVHDLRRNAKLATVAWWDSGRKRRGRSQWWWKYNAMWKLERDKAAIQYNRLETMEVNRKIAEIICATRTKDQVMDQDEKKKTKKKQKALPSANANLPSRFLFGRAPWLCWHWDPSRRGRRSWASRICSCYPPSCERSRDTRLGTRRSLLPSSLQRAPGLVPADGPRERPWCCGRRKERLTWCTWYNGVVCTGHVEFYYP